MNSNLIGRNLARGINYLFNPIVMPLYLFVALVFSSSLMGHYTIASKIAIMKVVVITTICMPILAFVPYFFINYYIEKKREKSSIEDYAQEPFSARDVSPSLNRIINTIVVLSSYVLSILMIQRFISLSLTLRIFCAPILAIIILNILSYLKIKTSIYSTAAGVVLAMLYIMILYKIEGLVEIFSSMLFVCGVIGSARIYLKSDTIKSVTIGVVVGIICSIISFYIGGLF